MARIPTGSNKGRPQRRVLLSGKAVTMLAQRRQFRMPHGSTSSRKISSLVHMGPGAPSAQLLHKDSDMHPASEDRRLHSNLLPTVRHSNNTQHRKPYHRLTVNRHLNSSSIGASHTNTLHSIHSNISSIRTRNSKPLQRPRPSQRLLSTCLMTRSRSLFPRNKAPNPLSQCHQYRQTRRKMLSSQPLARLLSCRRVTS